MKNIFTEKELRDGLIELIKRGYLKKTSKGFVDSDRVKSLLEEGKSRKQIAKILDKNFKGE